MLQKSVFVNDLMTKNVSLIYYEISGRNTNGGRLQAAITESISETFKEKHNRHCNIRDRNPFHNGRCFFRERWL
jgi:hypothetical protein